MGAWSAGCGHQFQKTSVLATIIAATMLSAGQSIGSGMFANVVVLALHGISSMLLYYPQQNIYYLVMSKCCLAMALWLKYLRTSVIII
jgi:hypothetical protein